MNGIAFAVRYPKRIMLVAAGAIAQNAAVYRRSVCSVPCFSLLVKADTDKIVIGQALKNIALCNAVFDDGIVNATLAKISGKDWRQENLVSLAGVYLPQEKIEDSTKPAALVQYLNSKPQIKKIVLHLDNDNTGRKAAEALKIILPDSYEVIDDPPPKGKDFNDFLCIQLGIARNKNKERSCERS